MEIWKPVTGYEGLYEVSSLGNVKSLNCRGSGKDKILSTSISNGYKQVCLSNNGKKTFYIHRIVTIAFLEKNINGIEVNHINGIRGDNRVENLEWCTHSYNIQHSYSKLGRKFHGKVGGNSSRKKLMKLNINNELIDEHIGIYDYCNKNGYDQGFISRCCKNGKMGYGFYWKMS